MGAVGVLGMGAGGYLLLRADALENDKQEAMAKEKATVDGSEQEKKYQQESKDAYESAVKHQHAAIITGGLGAVALGTAVYLYLRASGSTRSENASHFELTPLAQGGKVTLRGSF